MKFNTVSFILIVSLLTFVACETTTTEPIYLGKEYFGHTVGNWKIYNVDSIVYDDFLEEVFYYQYQVKEVNAGFNTNVHGDSSMVLERFWRKNPEDNWKTKNIWTSKLLQNKALRTEENITFVKLAFPTKINQAWDGNVYNTLEKNQYKIINIHEPLLLNEIQLDSTIKVMQKEFSTLINEDLQYEIYAVNIGMVKKVYFEVEKEIDGTIFRGVDYTYTLLEYGKSSD